MQNVTKAVERKYDIPLNDAIWISFKPIIKIYLSIGVGYILSKRGILTPTLSKGISRLLLIIFIPFLLFNNVVTQIKDTDIKLLGVIVFTGFIYNVIGLGYGFIVRFLTPTPRSWFGGLLMCCTLNNCSDIPLAYVQTIGKARFMPPDAASRGQSYCVLYTVMFIAFTFNFGGTRLIEWDFTRNDPRGDEPTVPLLSYENIKNIFTSPKNDEDKESSIGCDSEKVSSTDTGPMEAKSGNPPQVVVSYEEEQSSERTNSRDRIMGGSEVFYSSNDNSVIAFNRNNALPESPKPTKPRPNILEKQWLRFKTSWIRLKSMNKVNTYICNFFEDLFMPQMVALISGITVAMIPWVRRVFVKGQDIKNFHDAPDGNPPLDFVMDFLSFFAGAQVPLGLMLLGATMASLKIKKLVKGFWKTLILIVVFKLALLPIIACGWIHRIREIGWLSKDDPMSPIVLAVSSATPPATVQIYLTLAWIDPTKDNAALNCLAIALLVPYAILPFSLTIVMTYAVMNFV